MLGNRDLTWFMHMIKRKGIISSAMIYSTVEKTLPSKAILTAFENLLAPLPDIKLEQSPCYMYWYHPAILTAFEKTLTHQPHYQ